MLREVLPRLAGTLDVHLLGIGYSGPICDVGGATLHPTNLRGGDVFAAFAAAELAEELDARIVLLLHDFWMLHPHARTLADSRATVVAYVPVDGRIVDARYLEPLGAVDRFVAYTEFGRPLGSRTDGFVVLNANRPNERKRIDLTIEGFELFARGRPADVRLRLHHAVDASAHELSDRVEVTSSCLSDRDLNRLYNECHVGVNTAMGEGWGLVSFEHAATGAAQVVPDAGPLGELWAGAAEIVPAEDTGVPGFSPLAMRTVSAEDVAAALERLYTSPEHLQEMSDAAYRNATQPRYSWDAIGEQWRALLAEVLAA